ncbi:trypsin-like peptidase domain-containing protein [Actinomadura yumaensis]|uniref:S1C family serine protease n=1 Tax=Actinomadura yumaensis TaxID=111807 RepID=UPI0036083A05
MTEENRGPVKASPGDDDLVPGFGAERRDATGPQETAGPPETVADQEIPEPEGSAGPEAPAAAEPSGNEAPAGYGASAASETPAGSGASVREDDGPDRLVAGGFAPPDAPRDGRPTEGPPQDGPYAREMPVQQPPAGLEAPDERGRPAFAPHNQDPRAQQYGWPQHQSQQPPPPHPGARPMGPPPMGGGRWARRRPARGRWGRPRLRSASRRGPNWAPVPAMPSASRGGPSLGVLAVVALIVALVAGGVGAGIGVMATGSDDDGGGVNLGGSDSGTGPAVKSRPPDSVAGVAQKVLPSVVSIKAQAANGQGAGGTGFIVNGGYIVTNNHVVQAAGSGGEIQVQFNDKKTLPATIKGHDPGSDVAVLKPEGGHSLPALQVGNSDALAVGDPVIAIGSPLGLQGSVTTGIVSSLNRAVPTQGEGGGDANVLNAIQTDAAINPGNSGGPLVDAQGRVIGINTAILTLGGQSLGGEQQSGNIGLGFAIPINQGKRVAEEIIRTGTAKRAQLGIGMDQKYQGPGVKIAERATGGVEPVAKGGPAERAGLKAGDVITKLGDQPIEDPADLSAQIRSRAPGEKVKVTYVRAGKETTVEVTLGAAN